MELTREIVVYASEAEWLAARRADVTSTEAAALFGESPYLTAYELHHRKAGTLPVEDFTANDRMKWGNRLEAAIAYGVAEDLGLVVEPFKTYVRLQELRMGSSFDFRIVGIVENFSGDEAAREMFRQHGPGIMEIKNVDGLAFKRSWTDEGGELEAPLHIEIQVQHQLDVSGHEWSIIAPLVGGNTPRPIIRRRDADMGALIREKIREFWVRVDNGIEPTPEFARDKDTIAALYVNNNGAEIDLSTNNRLAELCMVRKEASDQIKVAEQVKDAATAEILTIIGDYKKAYAAGGFTISASTTAGGMVSYERKPFRSLRITHKSV